MGTKRKLSPKLAPDEAEIKKLLTELNHWDIKLFEYAQSLLAYRLKFVLPVVDQVKMELGLSVHSHVAGRVQTSREDGEVCKARTMALPQELKKELGVFQPPKHKAPL